MLAVRRARRVLAGQVLSAGVGEGINRRAAAGDRLAARASPQRETAQHTTGEEERTSNAFHAEKLRRLAWRRLLISRRWDGLPPDLAANPDHYLHGFLRQQ